MRIAFHTFGCRLNRAETLDSEALAIAEGHEIVEPGPDAEIIEVRACSVTARAQRDCEKFIEKLKKDCPQAEIRVTGCIPGAIRDKKNVPSDIVSMRTARAYLKVQDGCSGRCAFCIVPQFRGAPVSVPLADIINKAEKFIASGFREIVVTGCNLALYRSEGDGLGKLLSLLASLDPAVRIRLSSYEPCICDDSLLDAFIRHDNICKFLHISLQSGSDAVLKRMNRPYTSRQAAEFLKRVRENFGERFMLGCDVICGFPGESEEDFSKTRDILERFAFCNVHAFPYSERPGTPAAAMDGSVPNETRHERVRTLLADANARKEKFVESFVSRETEVCIEREGDESSGWTGEYLPCTVSGSFPRRSLVKCTVTKTVNGELFAEKKEVSR
jgi:threonylcarbamoyladenosine tRNA methylthiotransferase MtaB